MVRPVRIPNAPADAADRIVLATLAVLERDGLDALTVRGIAREAGVNIAAISYYFRGKDDLVALVLERALDRGVKDPLDDFDRLSASGKDARVALAGAVEGFLETAVQFPRTVVAQLHGPIVMQDYRRDVVVRMNALLDRLFARLRKRLVGRGDAQKRATLGQLWSTVLMTAIAPMLLRPFARVDLRDAKQRRAWVSSLVARAVTDAPRPRANRRQKAARRSPKRTGARRSSPSSRSSRSSR